jgi:hypothetical protein
VPNSPVWDEVNPDSIEILHFDILGIDVDPRILPQELQDAIYALSNEVEFEMNDKHLPYHLCAR